MATAATEHQDLNLILQAPLSIQPQFLVIGAQKAGTTWLQKQLGAHPAVFSPRHKELHFFDKAGHWERGVATYERWFSGCRPEQIAGEYTPNYLWEPDDPDEARESGHLPGVARRVAETYPEIRWIAILRDPVDRAVSAYYHHIRAGRIHPNQRLREVWHRFGIRSMGLYARGLHSWLECFPPEQGLVLMHETDLLQTPEPTLAQLYRFLGVDPQFLPQDLARPHNPRSSHFLLRLQHRCPPLARLIGKLDHSFGSRWQRFHIPVGDDERAVLCKYFTQPNQQLQDLLGRRLPWP